jgi:hypothetical protein
MLWVGFEPTIPVFERAKTIHVLDRATSVVGEMRNDRWLIISWKDLEGNRSCPIEVLSQNFRGRDWSNPWKISHNSQGLGRQVSNEEPPSTSPELYHYASLFGDKVSVYMSISFQPVISRWKIANTAT